MVTHQRTHNEKIHKSSLEITNEWIVHLVEPMPYLIFLT